MTRQNIGGVLLALSDQLPACRRFIRHQTHSMAYAIADSHRFLPVLLRRGVVQWLSIHLHIKPLTDYFAHLMYRQYINESSVWGGGRPQFLFAEPSYIGMHLFGVLLPLMWLMRGLCQAVAQPHRCVCDWRCANAGRHPDRSSCESTRVLTRYAGCSPIRGRCLPDMAPATSSTRYGPARSMRDDC